MPREQVANKLHEGRARARRAAIFACQSTDRRQAILQRARARSYSPHNALHSPSTIALVFLNNIIWQIVSLVNSVYYLLHNLQRLTFLLSELTVVVLQSVSTHGHPYGSSIQQCYLQKVFAILLYVMNPCRIFFLKHTHSYLLVVDSGRPSSCTVSSPSCCSMIIP